MENRTKQNAHVRTVDAETDASDIASIYNHFVLHTDVTFETEAVAVDAMKERIREISAGFPYFVCELDGKVAGYVYAHAWNARPAYSKSVSHEFGLAAEHLFHRLIFHLGNKNPCKRTKIRTKR